MDPGTPLRFGRDDEKGTGRGVAPATWCFDLLSALAIQKSFR
jgi:hypothetical protein